MARRPRHPKPDANQAEIVDAFRTVGYEVLDISAICSFADIAVWGVDGVSVSLPCWKLFEIKTDDGKLTDTEQEFQAEHPGAVQTIRCIEDGLRAFGRLEGERVGMKMTKEEKRKREKYDRDMAKALRGGLTHNRAVGTALGWPMRQERLLSQGYGAYNTHYDEWYKPGGEWDR